MQVENNELYFAVKEGGTIPTKRDGDGWYDVYAKYTDHEYYEVPPLEVRLIPTGLHTACSSKYRMSVGERGSNTKSGLMTMAGKIDSNYNGEWFIALYNADPHTTAMICDSKSWDCSPLDNSLYRFVDIHKAIAQFAVEEVPIMEIKECSVEDILSRPSERGTGCLGSSNK